MHQDRNVLKIMVINLLWVITKKKQAGLVSTRGATGCTCHMAAMQVALCVSRHTYSRYLCLWWHGGTWGHLGVHRSRPFNSNNLDYGAAEIFCIFAKKGRKIEKKVNVDQQKMQWAKNNLQWAITILLSYCWFHYLQCRVDWPRGNHVPWDVHPNFTSRDVVVTPA